MQKITSFVINWIHKFIVMNEDLELDESGELVLQFIKKLDISSDTFIPYIIQSMTWNAIKLDRCMFLTSGTGSGKTYAIILGIIERIKSGKGKNCLLIYPTKALAQDQEMHLREIGSKLGIKISRLDASVKKNAKKLIKEDPSEILITNPEFLFGTLIGSLDKDKEWVDYLLNVSMIWIDEFHAMSGTLGTTLCYFIRILSSLNPSLRFYFTSATLPNVEEIARLFPNDPKVITGGSRHGKIEFHIGKKTDLAKVLRIVLHDSGQFLVFIENKNQIEKIFNRYNLLEKGINRYHGDLIDSDRNLILDKFSKNEYKGLLCTSAISVGIDIPSVKNIVFYDFPRSFSLLFQEMGRGVRNPNATGNVFLLLNENRLIDNYYANNPKKLEGEIRKFEPEQMILDLLNEKILRAMILFSIRFGITKIAVLQKIFKEADRTGQLVQTLTWLLIKGLVSKRKNKYYFKKPPSKDDGNKEDIIKQKVKSYLIDFFFNLRSCFPEYTIKTIIKENEMELGKIGADKIPFKACVGNYYQKDGISYEIKRIDEKKHIIYADRSNEFYVSRNDVSSTVSMIDELNFADFGRFKLRYANFKVRVRPTNIVNLKYEGENLIERNINKLGKFENKFSLEFNTKGVLMELTLDDEDELHLSGSVLYQLSKIILRNAVVIVDISENEVDCYQELDRKMIYFLDRASPTGVTKQIFDKFFEILQKTKEILISCGCKENGCKKCSIPVESNYLMPNLHSEDIYRKKEMIDILEWVGA